MIPWRPTRYPVPKWVMKRMHRDVLESMLEAHRDHGLDDYTDRLVRLTLLSMRWSNAVQPYTRIFKLAWEVIRGKYWRTAKAHNRGADPSSGAGAGAGNQSGPVQQAGYGPNPAFSSGGAGAGPGVIFAAAPPPAPIGSYDVGVRLFEEGGIKAGEIVAYRTWNINTDGLLTSVVQNYVWDPDKPAEGDTSSWGIFAFKSVLDLHQYGKPEPNVVSGTVWLWGDVYEYTHGYRAQFAAVRSIDDSPFYDAKALRKRYGLTRKRKQK